MSDKSPPPSEPLTEITPDLLAAAAQKRMKESTPSPEAMRAQEYELRIMFRRLIDPGITRPNSKDVAQASLKTLLTIAENLLREPENPKYQQFKATNDTIKRRLIEPKGALEYAIALGFRPDVQNFQPFYRHSPKRMTELRVGAAIIKEAVQLETEKQERLDRSKREEKAAAAAVASNIKLAFLDDRKSRMQHDARERERRAAREAAIARGDVPEPALPAAPVPAQAMPGTGHTLVPMRSDVSADDPSTNNEDDDDDEDESD